MTDLALHDTIAALATAPGESGIAIVRVSGKDAEQALKALFVPYAKDCPFETHKLYLGKICFEGSDIDECMAVIMRAPKSYTREDVVEFHLHGGAWAAGETLRALNEIGVRPAEPGEFTMRAFLSGRIDLSSAEAVMRLIGANGRKAAQSALRQLSGGSGAFIVGIQKELISLIASLEAAIDYPEEIEEQEAAKDIAEKARVLAQKLQSACDDRAARLMDEGFEVAICGRPNAGKSTLLNALLQEERAIVTDIPGTTRDIVSGSMILNGIKINLKDTAGLRESTDTVEQIGVDRALKASQNADLTLLLIDASKKDEPENLKLLAQFSNTNCRVVYTKSDLCPEPFPLKKNEILISAAQNIHIDELNQLIADEAAVSGDAPLTMQRHITLARRAAQSLISAAQSFESDVPLEFGAVDLHEALNDLARITGEQVDERMLDDIFSRFCVGK